MINAPRRGSMGSLVSDIGCLGRFGQRSEFSFRLFFAASKVSAAIVFQDNFAAKSPGSLLNCTGFAN